MNPLPHLRVALLALTGLFTACRLSQTSESPPLPLSQRVTWKGQVASRYRDSLPAIAVDSDPSREPAPIRIHSFEFAAPDTLRLRLQEYREAFQAFAAFQKFATPWDMAEGGYRDGNALVFQHGPFLGRLTSAQTGSAFAGFLRENLSFQGEELFSKPGEFSAFPLLGRIPHSERVIPGHFLGRSWNGPVFTVAYRCHADTATAFRAFPQNADTVHTWMQAWKGKSDTLSWGREIHFQGWDEFHRPLILWVFSEGLMGFAGCADPILAGEYAQKMQKTAVLWAKP
ncbi:MAG TPA: DUF6599 family protein [Fibrobacteria bacterium]|nr:DUF6599 family protein [Fibrobacteria bacterium]